MWFTFDQKANVGAWAQTFNITDAAGHFVCLEADSRDEAHQAFKERTGISLERDDCDCYDDDRHYPWTHLSSYYEPTEVPTIFEMEFVDDPYPMLYRISTFLYADKVPIHINLYPKQGEPTVLKFWKKDLEKARAKHQAEQPRLWAAHCGQYGAYGPRRVFQTDFDPNLYYAKDGNFGGEAKPEKESSPKGHNYALYTSESKGKAQSYIRGAKRVFAAAVDAAKKELAAVRKEEGTGNPLYLGAKRAYTLLKHLT